MSTKVLRIGLIQGKKVVEERRLKSRISVSVGTELSNTFKAEGEGVPKAWELFELKGGKYKLLLSNEMNGHLQIGGEKRALSDIRDTAQRRGNAFVISLDEQSGGRVQLGPDTSLLFHFVEPQVAAAAALPVEIKGGVWSTLEPYFTSVLAFSFVAHAFFVGAVSFSERTLEAPSREDVLQYMQKVPAQKINVKISKVEPKRVEKEVEKPATQEKTKVLKAKVTKERVRKTSLKSSMKKSAAEKDQERKAAANAALAILIASTEGAESSVTDIFDANTSISRDLGNAIAESNGVRVSGEKEGVKRKDASDSNESADIERLKTQGGEKITKQTKKRQTQLSKLKLDTTPLEGTVDKRAVARSLKRRAGAYQQCYESALKTNNSLKGKLVIEFTINKNGKVSDTDVVRDGLGSSAVSRCIAGVLKRIRFAKPDEGEVTIRNSFVFSPNG